MKKKLTIVVMVVLAAILIASPVLAAGSSHPMEVANPSPKKQPTIISMTATILAIDAANDKIYVKIQMTNRAFIQYRGKEKWVHMTSTTKFFSWDGKTRTRIYFKDLKVYDKVSVNARVNPATQVFKARRVQRSQPRIP